MWQKNVQTPAGPLLIAAAAVGEVDPEYPLTGREALYLQRFRSPAKRRQWLTARALLHHTLRLSHNTEILNRPNGPPYLSDRSEPISISHTHGFAAIATAPGAGPYTTVGIDIEASRPARDFSVRRMFMNAEELAIYAAHPCEPVFLAIWSAKEALYKAFYRVDGEITFKEHLGIAAETLLALPPVLPVQQQTHTLLAQIDLPGRPRELPVGLVLDKGFVVTYLRV